MKAIVFDLDGTLVDSAPDIHAASNSLLAEQGAAPVTLQQVRSFIGAGADVLVARLMAARQIAPDAALQQAMTRRFIEHYEGSMTLTRLYPGVAQALTALAEDGWRMGLCTNKPLGPSRMVLEQFAIAHHFSVVIGGDSLAVRKPDPAPLLAALVRLGAGRAVYVGDSETDAATAVAARQPFALYTQGYRNTPVEAVPHQARFDHFDSLPVLVRDLIAG